jgi:hypothetical protein
MRDATSHDRSIEDGVSQGAIIPPAPSRAPSQAGRRTKMLSKYAVAALALALVAGSASLASAASHSAASTMMKSDSTVCSQKLINHYPSNSTVQRELSVLKSNPECAR